MLVTAGSARMTLMHGELVSSVEVYDPKANSWQQAGSLREPRCRGAGHLLAKGEVLLAGGALDCLNVAPFFMEIWSPQTGSSRAVKNERGFFYATQTLLADGRLLVVGMERLGDSSKDGYEMRSKALDPATSQWSTLSRAPVQLLDHSAVRLSSGAVLVSGGERWEEGAELAAPRTPVNKSFLYEPAKDAWTEAGALSGPRVNHTSVALGDGSALVIGGWTAERGELVSSVERFHDGRWRTIGDLPLKSGRPLVTVLSDGRVLFLSGSGKVPKAVLLVPPP